MLQLTQNQHLIIIKSLVEHAGGIYRLLNNELPAYKIGDSEWKELKEPADIDAFSVAKSLRLKIQDIPVELDGLGIIGKIKDYNKVNHILKVSQVENPDFRFLTPYQQASYTEKKLKESGMISPLSGFNKVLTNIFNQTSVPQNVFLELKNSSQVMVWKEHHLRLQTPPIPEDKLDRSGSVPVVSDHSILFNALRKASSEHYMRPDMFVNSVHSELAKRNIALTFKTIPGDVDELSESMKFFLKDVLAVYKDDSKELFSKVSNVLVMEYRPLDLDTRTIGVKNGIKMIRDLMDEYKNKSPYEDLKSNEEKSKPDTVDYLGWRGYSGHDFEEKEDVLVSLSIRQGILSWRKALDSISESVDENIKNQLNEKWENIFSELDVSVNTPIEQLKTAVSRVEKVYGSLVTRTADNNFIAIKNMIGNHPDVSEEKMTPLKDSLNSIVEFVMDSSKQQSPVQYLKTSEMMPEVFNDNYIRASKNNFLSNYKNLPTLNDFRSKLENVTSKIDDNQLKLKGPK